MTWCTRSYLMGSIVRGRRIIRLPYSRRHSFTLLRRWGLPLRRFLGIFRRMMRWRKTLRKSCWWLRVSKRWLSLKGCRPSLLFRPLLRIPLR
jgi:hypothetical protein